MTRRSDAVSVVVGSGVWLGVTTVVVCATPTSVTAALVVDSVSPDVPDGVVVDSFISVSIRPVFAGSVARGLLVVSLNDGVGLVVSAELAVVGGMGAGVVSNVSFEDTDRSLSLFSTFTWITSASVIWLGTGRVSFIASEKRVFAMVISSVSNVSLDDRGLLSVVKSREINATVAASVGEFPGLRVSCVVDSADSNDAFSLASLEDAVSEPTVSCVVVSRPSIAASVVVSVFGNDQVVVSTLVVGLGVLVESEITLANCGLAVATVVPGVVLGTVVPDKLPCKRDKMS